MTAINRFGWDGLLRTMADSTYLYPGGSLMSAAAFDETGHPVRQVSYGYDATGTSLPVSGSAEPVTYTYDALYRVQTLTDGNGHATHYYYRKAGYLDSMTYPGYSGPTFDGEDWSNISGPDSLRNARCDADGHLLKSVDGGTETDFALEGFGAILFDIDSSQALNAFLRAVARVPKVRKD